MIKLVVETISLRNLTLKSSLKIGEMEFMIIFPDFHNLFRFLWKCSLCHHQIINLQTHEKENDIQKCENNEMLKNNSAKVKHHFSNVTCRRHLCQRIEMSPKLKSESTSSYCIIRNVNFSLNAPWYWLLAASWPNISIRHDSFEYVMKPVECGSYRNFFFIASGDSCC